MGCSFSTPSSFQHKKEQLNAEQNNARDLRARAVIDWLILTLRLYIYIYGTPLACRAVLLSFPCFGGHSAAQTLPTRACYSAFSLHAVAPQAPVDRPDSAAKPPFSNTRREEAFVETIIILLHCKSRTKKAVCLASKTVFLRTH